MTIRSRFLTVLSISALAGAVIFAALAVALVRSTVRDRSVDRLHAECGLMAAWISGSPDIDPHEFVEIADAELQLRVTLIDENGVVIADSRQERAAVARMDNHAGRPEIIDAARSRTGESFRRSSTTGEEYFYSATRLPDGAAARYVRLALPSSDVSRIQSRYAWLILLMIPAAIAALVVVGYGAVRRLSRPLERLAVEVEQAADHEHRIDVPPESGDELARLAAAVRSMQNALISRMAELDAERSMMSSVIDGIREGLLVVGQDRVVRLANRQLREILELPFDPVGHDLAEVVRQPTAIENIESALDSGTEVHEPTVRLPSGRAFQLSVAPLRQSADVGGDAAVVLFHDITQLEKLESVRREFVANVSHELRTPLTSIKAFVETLSEGGLEDQESASRFLGIVRKHADRMGDLIEDLTDLSLIETGAISLNPARISPEQITRSVADDLEPLAVRRNMRLEIDFGEGATVYADPRRLEQMITNLVNNALKFSPPGSIVRVCGRPEGDSYRISVEDHGIGIPEESLDKVFHRFFQQNREESREMGGTGLGLSIVKHLMRLHQGRVQLESEFGRGSTFSLIFPAHE